MAERPIDQLTVREVFTNSERLVRELIDHLERSFLPKVNDLERLLRPPSAPGTEAHAKEKTAGKEKEEKVTVADVTVRNQVATVLTTDDYSQNLLKKLNEYLVAVDNGARRAVEGS